MKCIVFSLVAALALGSFAQAGAVNPVRLTARVEAHDCWYRTATFRAGEVASIFVEGDGDTDLDLYVYDQNGNLVAYDDDLTDTCYVSWVPKWTGPFLIKIVNRGSVYNQFVLLTN
jgi:hypothetical protein